MPTDDRPARPSSEPDQPTRAGGAQPRADPSAASPTAPHRQAQRAVDDDEVAPSVQYGEDPGVP